VQLNGTGAAAVYLAYGFFAPASKTINTVRVFVSAVAGTLAATDLQLDVYSDTPGTPNASLSSTTNIGGTAPTGTGWITFQGLSQAVSGGTQYWLVIRNNNAIQGTNNATFRQVFGCLSPAFAGVNVSNLWGGNICLKSSNAGSTWGVVSGTATGSVRVGFSDGSYWGFPVSNNATGADKAFGSNEVGVKFTSPANAILNVAGIALPVTQSGSPTGNLRFRLYNDTTLLGTTANVLQAYTGNASQWYYGYFGSDIVVQPGTVLRASFCDSAADSSSAFFRTSNEVTVDSDSNSLALMPFEGTLQKTTFNGTSWTDTNTSIIPFALILDSAGEFGASCGGMLYIPDMSGM
jgi:hypothetical protein